MKEKLRAFLHGAGVILFELALLYPAIIVDYEITWQIRLQLGVQPAWVEWLLRSAFWFLVFALPISAYVAWRYWTEGRRRAARLKDCVIAAKSGRVRLAGRAEWREFRADMLVKLVVPDAVVALDKTHGLLRLKAVNHFQDAAIDLRDLIGIDWQEGVARSAPGPQALFRRFHPSYRTLAEHPRIRLEIATKGKDPVFEYNLLAKPKDRHGLRAIFDALERTARYARGTNPATTVQVLDALPVQGSKYEYGVV